MKIIHKLLFPIILLLLVVACDKIPLVDGLLAIRTDWTKRTIGVDIPDPYNILFDGQEISTRTIVTQMPSVIAGDTYIVNIYNDANHVTIDDTYISVATSGNVVENNPGWFFAAKDTFLGRYSLDTVTVDMVQHIRQLDVILEITNGNASQISYVTSELYGVANSYDFATHIYGSSGLKTDISFNPNATGFDATARLLGIIDTESQILNLDIHYVDGTNQVITSDITTLMADFNDDKVTPKVITTNLSVYTADNITAEIEDWVNEGDIPGNAKP